ncbi:hypothetical protein SOVF_164120 [Spinacia oleracea]|uniref:GRIP domain-containing protein n=1 Tax=Spinacia oleracea TaxID=3562 RepID=A0A9R0IIP4_SPIOL|nr:uncharacterized protein LOC110789371 [Spinacia oleracea]KNA08256.1 hypothetical protein SOVF_164120 [Spinacia oleracea]
MMRGTGSAGSKRQQPSWTTTIYLRFRAAEFEILFFLFFLVAFLFLKDLISRPEYNQILVKKPQHDFWPF